jgi:cyclic lactone autoinducer peptide
MSNKLTKLPLKIVSSMALKTARREANSACLFMGYQPKAPSDMKKLRKF